MLRNAQREMTKFFRDLTASDKEQTVIVTEAPLIDYLLGADESHRQAVIEMVAAAMHSFLTPDAERRECFGCLKKWQAGRAIATVVVLDFPGFQPRKKGGKVAGILSGMCAECAGDQQILLAACKRDLGIEDVKYIHSVAGHA